MAILFCFYGCAVRNENVSLEKTIVKDGQTKEYSNIYLSNLMNRLGVLCAENASNPDSVWSQVRSVSQGSNCISVEILNLDDSQIGRFKAEVIDSEAIDPEAFKFIELSMEKSILEDEYQISANVTLTIK